jgi:pimeloyl-ACP methyl ester carboxylesterase
MTATPVVFVHGLWLHASSWDPWLELFARAGYDPVAPRWPGEHETVAGARADTGPLAARGIDDVTEHLAGIIAALPAPPVLIGHSFGGLLVEKLLAQGRGRAGIAIDAAQIKGVLPLPLSALRAAFPVLRDPANKHRAVALTADQFHYAFGNAIEREESDRLYERWAIPAPGRPLFEAAEANFSAHSPAAVDTRNSDRGPLLLIMGGKDHTVPEAITRSTAKQYRHSTAVTDVVEFPDRGHSLVIDSGWRDVAEACLTWLEAHEL